MITPQEQIADLRSQVRTLKADLASKSSQLVKAQVDRHRFHLQVQSLTRRLGKYEKVDPPESDREDPTRQFHPRDAAAGDSCS